MLLLALVILVLLGWWATRPARSSVRRPGVALTVVGAVTAVVMPWMMFPFLLLAIGVLLTVISFVRQASNAAGPRR